MILPLIALTFSAGIIVALCIGDPKRRRTAGLADGGMPVATRRVLAGAACLPGLACVLLGDAAAFMIWLGGCSVAGWLVASGFGKSRQDAG